MLARNSLYSLMGAALPAVLLILTVPFYIGAIGAERYGALAIAWLLLGYFGQADFGIGRAITQRIAAMRDAARAEQAGAVWSALISVLAFGALGAVVLYASGHYYFSGQFVIAADLRGEVLDAVWLIALCNPVVALSGVLSGALMGAGRFRLVSIANGSSGCALQVFPLATAWLIGPDLAGLILSALVARVIGAMLLAAGVWLAILRGQRPAFHASELRHLARFGAWAMLTALVAPMMGLADRFVIGAINDAAAVAAYAVPYQVARGTMILPTSLIQAIFPRFASETLARSRDMCRAFSAFTGQAFAPVMIVLICLSTPLFELWLGARLDPRSPAIARIILAGFWFNAVAGLPFAFIQARGDPRFTALLQLVELPAYVAMLFGLNLAFGLPGIAAAFALRCAIDCVALLVKARVSGDGLAWRLAGPALLVTGAVAAGPWLGAWREAIPAAAVLGGLAGLIALRQMPGQIRERLAALPCARLVPGLAG